MKLFHSMYASLFVTMLAITIIPVVLLQTLFTNNVIRIIRENRVDIVKEYCVRIAGEMRESGYLKGNPSELISDEISQFCGLYDGRAVVCDNDYNVKLDTYGRIQGLKLVSEESLEAMKGNEISRYDKSSDRICLTYVIRDEDDKSASAYEGEVQGMLLFVISCEDLTDVYHRIASFVTYIMLALGAVLVLLSYRFSRKFTSPFNTLARTINSISEGGFEEELKLEGFDEIEQISDAFNSMLAKLKKLEDSRQEFVSNVSHELKTPLTSMKVLADSINMQPDAPPELYREFMQDITAEIDRETTIINDLLSLVRMDKMNSELNISEINVNEMLETIVKRIRPIAAKRNVRIELVAENVIKAQCDEIKLSLALSNLVENAVKYNVYSGWVKVSLDSDEEFFFVTISDSGIGIAQEYQEKIFDRFYRVDKARSRESGGTGLGLAITKSVIQMHRGAIKVSSREDEGTVFYVRIPLICQGETE